MWLKNPINIFWNGGDQIFIQICPGDEIFRKSRQLWTETQHRGCDEINNGGQKLKHGLENLTISQPREPDTFTNWRNIKH